MAFSTALFVASLLSSLFAPATALPTPDLLGNMVAQMGQIAGQMWTGAPNIVAPDEGWYTIKNVAIGAYLDLNGGYITPGNPLIGWEYNGNPNQMWYLQADPTNRAPGWFQIQSGADPNKATYVGISNGPPVASTSQKSWIVKQNKSGTWTFFTGGQAGVLTLTMTNGSSPSPVKLVASTPQMDMNPTTQQQWILTRVNPVGSGLFFIRSAATPQNGMSTIATPNYPVTVQKAGMLQTQWMFSAAADRWGATYIQEVHRGLYLAPPTQKNQALQLSATPTAWVLNVTSAIGASKLTFYLVSTDGDSKGQVADIYDGSTSTGAGIIAWDSHMGPNQQWLAERVG